MGDICFQYDILMEYNIIDYGDSLSQLFSWFEVGKEYEVKAENNMNYRRFWEEWSGDVVGLMM